MEEKHNYLGTYLVAIINESLNVKIVLLAPLPLSIPPHPPFVFSTWRTHLRKHKMPFRHKSDYGEHVHLFDERYGKQVPFMYTLLSKAFLNTSRNVNTSYRSNSYIQGMMHEVTYTKKGYLR